MVAGLQFIIQGFHLIQWALPFGNCTFLETEPLAVLLKNYTFLETEPLAVLFGYYTFLKTVCQR